MKEPITLFDVCEALLGKLENHIENNRNSSKFDIDFEFKNESGVFNFVGWWTWQDDAETKIEIQLKLDDCLIQYPDFEVKFDIPTLEKIENYILKQKIN